MRDPRVRRKPVQVSRLEMEAIIAELPVLSPGQGQRHGSFWIRPRVETQWLSGLSVETLDLMRGADLEEHGTRLRLHTESDRARFGAVVELPPRLARVLASVRNC